MSETILNEAITTQVRDLFAQLGQPVQLLFFGSQAGCDYCADTLQLVSEVAALSNKLGLSVYDIEADADLARHYHVDKTPSLVVAGKDGDQITDFGVRLAGIPAGHEFSTLIHDILLVSSRDSGLDAKTRAILKGITQPIHLQVFVTPT
ncbi:MAG: thioredoxin family protein [Chloroflexi bacterium]|nr:thioredoxin family protein [Chloroflexota bacterium]